jgi:hypothetical protein
MGVEEAPLNEKPKETLKFKPIRKEGILTKNKKRK